MIIFKRLLTRFLFIFLFLLISKSADTQDYDIIQSDFDTLIQKDISWYMYVGDGDFMGSRSCRDVWIAVHFDQIRFNKSDSTLFINGYCFDDARHDNPVIMNFQLFVGKYEVTDSPHNQAKIDIKQKFVFDSSRFNVSFKFTPEDYLCFTLIPSIEINEEDNRKHFSVIGHKIELYKIGGLLN